MGVFSPASSHGSTLFLLAKSQIRDALRHPVSPLASLVGVALAALALTAVHLLSGSIRAALGGADAAFAHTHLATRDGLVEGDYFALRQRWRNGELANVEALLPVVEGYVRAGGETLHVLGFDPLAGDVFADLGERDDLAWPGEGRSGAESGRAFLLGDVVLADEAAAAAIAAAGGDVAGVYPQVLAGQTATILADLPTAQRLLGREGRLDAIWVRASGVRSRLLGWLDQALPGIAAAMPEYADPVLDGFQVTARERWDPTRRFADASTFNLSILGTLSLLMAAFLSVQAARSSASRRRLEHQRLLAIGVSAAKLRGVAAAEGLLVGLLGTALGMTLGIVVAEALANAAGAPSPVLDGWVVGKAVLGGVLASALAPAFVRHTSRGGERDADWLRHGIGALVAVAAALSLTAGSLLAAFTALLLICALHIAYVVPLAAAGLGRSAGLAKALASRANLRSAAAASGEIRLALGALSIAAAVAIGMGIMVESLRRDFTAMLGVSLWEGVHATLPDARAVDDDWLRGLPGVVDVRRYGEVAGRLASGPVTLRFADLDASETARYGLDGALDDHAMANEGVARHAGIGIGDRVPVSAANAHFDVPVGHVFRDYRSASPRLILPLSFAAQVDPAAVEWRQISVLTEPDAAPAIAAALRERHPEAQTLDHAEIRRVAEVVFDRSFAVSRSLTTLALLVAVVGLYAALTALQANREREFRLFSALGFARVEVWRLALTQTALVGAVAAVAAVPLGLAIAWVLCTFVNPAAFGWSIDLRIDAASVLLPVALAIGAALLAGALPTYRAAFRGSA